MTESAFFPSKNYLSSYILIGNRVRDKSSGMAPGLANARPRAAQNLQMPHPRDWKGRQMPRSSPGAEVGGGEEMGAAGIDWCITFWKMVKFTVSTNDETCITFFARV